ncbi:MAG: NUDIX hydrolase [Rhodothermaceae bacterium]|nr:NUDIX hydrolase [Rhodothermaceae bacterium]
MSLGKVTCFITCNLDGRKHVLLLKHPYAGNQIPAGTVEKGESFVAAALREAREETGLAALHVVAELLSEREKLPPNTAVIQKTSTVYSRPDTSSFDWVTIRRGIRVDTRETENGFVQIDYVEKELLGSDRISFQITGWIPQDALTTNVERKHYHLSCAASDELEWEVFSDHHKFVLMWHPLTEDPQLQEPFGEWFDSIKEQLVHDLK